MLCSRYVTRCSVESQTSYNAMLSACADMTSGILAVPYSLLSVVDLKISYKMMTDKTSANIVTRRSSNIHNLWNNQSTTNQDVDYVICDKYDMSCGRTGDEYSLDIGNCKWDFVWYIKRCHQILDRWSSSITDILVTIKLQFHTPGIDYLIDVSPIQKDVRAGHSQNDWELSRAWAGPLCFNSGPSDAYVGQYINHYWFR